MNQRDPTPPSFPQNAFGGTAPYYVRYRVPYPDALLADLVSRSEIKGRDRLLDLACGPGRLTLALARHFREVWAVDLEPEMIEAAKTEAARLKTKNVLWSIGNAEELDAPAAGFDLVSIGDAFHRLDQPRVAACAFKWLKPGQCIAILGSYSILGGREPWQRIVIDVLGRWSSASSPTTGAMSSRQNKGDPKLHGQELLKAGFVGVATYSFFEAHEWTLDSIVGFLYSTSVCSLAVLGKNAGMFETEIRSALMAHDPTGVYREQIQWGYTIGRKPI